MGRKPTKRTQATKALKEYASKGYSANKIQKLLKSDGLGMRRQRILQEVRLAKNKQVKENRFNYVPQKYRKPYIKIGKQTYLFRVSLILNDVPIHSKPFQRNYLGFRLQAFSTNEKLLRSKMSHLRSLLIELVEKYIGYRNSEWWFSDSTYIGYEYPVLMSVSNPYFLNNRWIFRVEKEGREIKSGSGNL